MALIDLINRRFNAEKLKKELPNIVLQWETDPVKIDFKKLRSYKGLESYFSQEMLRIENVDISNEIATYDVLSNPSCIDMLEIILNGGKLIPPAFIERYAIVDGKEQKVSSVSGGFDGLNRMGLARSFGLTSIPVCVFKTYAGHWFTPDQWTFEGVAIGNTGADYNGVKAVSKVTGESFTFREYGAIVDSSNADYIVILAAPADRPF